MLLIESEDLLAEIKEMSLNVKVNNNLNDELVKNPDWIFISTPHSVAPDIAIDSLQLHVKTF